MSRTIKEAPLLTVALNVDINAANNPAMTIPLIPTGRNSISTIGITFSGSVIPATPTRASSAIPVAMPQRTIRKKLQAAPSLAASRALRDAKNIWKSNICAGPPAFSRNPFSTQTITRAPKSSNIAFSVPANSSIRHGILSDVQS